MPAAPPPAAPGRRLAGHRHRARPGPGRRRRPAWPCVAFAAAGPAIAAATHLLVTAAPGEAGRSGARRPCRRHRRGAARCAGSATSPPPASMATAAAAGWMRRRRPRPASRAAAAGWRPSRPGRRWPTAAPRSTSSASAASTARAAARWTICRPAPPAARSSRATPFAASIATTSRWRSAPRGAGPRRPAGCGCCIWSMTRRRRAPWWWRRRPRCSACAPPPALPFAAGRGRHVRHGAQFLGGEPAGRQCRDQGGARHRLALSRAGARA